MADAFFVTRAPQSMGKARKECESPVLRFERKAVSQDVRYQKMSKYMQNSYIRGSHRPSHYKGTAPGRQDQPGRKTQARIDWCRAGTGRDSHGGSPRQILSHKEREEQPILRRDVDRPGSAVGIGGHPKRNHCGQSAGDCQADLGMVLADLGASVTKVETDDWLRKETFSKGGRRSSSI